MSIDASLAAVPVVDPAAVLPAPAGSAVDGAVFAELVSGLLDGAVPAPVSAPAPVVVPAVVPVPAAVLEAEAEVEEEPLAPEVPVDAAHGLAVLVPVPVPVTAAPEAPAAVVAPPTAPAAAEVATPSPAEALAGSVLAAATELPPDLPPVVPTATEEPTRTAPTGPEPVPGTVPQAGPATPDPDADRQDAPPSAPPPAETVTAQAATTTPTVTPTSQAAPAAPVVASTPTVTPEVRAATQHVVDEVVRLTEASAGAPRQLVLRLDPGTLGEVHVRLRVHDGVVRVHLTAGDAAVREALASDVGRLHTLLGTRLDDVRVVVQDLPRTPAPTPTAPERAAQPPTGGHHEPSGGRGSGHQPGHAPELGRPTWTSDVTRATDGTHRWVPRPTTADPHAAGPHRLDVSV